MNKTAILCFVLFGALIVSNSMWLSAYKSVPSPPAYQQPPPHVPENSEVDRELLRPLKNAIAASAMPGATEQSIVSAAQSDRPIAMDCGHSPLATRVRGVSLFFNEQGKLVGATTEPCFDL